MDRKGKDANKHVVLAGCVPQGAPQQAYIKGLSVIGVQQIDRVVEVVEETLKGNTLRAAFGSSEFKTERFQHLNVITMFSS